VGHAGHTLIELVTVLALIAIASALAYPSLGSLRGAQELEGAAVGLLYDLRSARWRAVVSGRRVRCVPGRDAQGVSRYRVEREEGGGWSAEGGERLLPRGAALSAAGPLAKVFNPDGTCTSGSLALRGANGALYRYTFAPATGRVRFYRGYQEVAGAK
jgi:prepilin-type N-terminal cleavage/methylation domain-containing protein